MFSTRFFPGRLNCIVCFYGVGLLALFGIGVRAPFRWLAFCCSFLSLGDWSLSRRGVEHLVQGSCRLFIYFYYFQAIREYETVFSLMMILSGWVHEVLSEKVWCDKMVFISDHAHSTRMKLYLFLKHKRAPKSTSPIASHKNGWPFPARAVFPAKHPKFRENDVLSI